MKSIWIDKSNQPDVPKLGALGITRPLFDITDPQVNKTFLNKWRQPPFDTVGVYACANQADWNAKLNLDPDHDWSKDPVAFAGWLSRRLGDVAAGTGSTFPRVTANIEKDWVAAYPGGLAAYMTAFFTEWRNQRPYRVTSWALDGYQGGLWFGRANDLLVLQQANLEEIQPECFGKAISTPTGTVLEPFDVAGTVKDLVDYGFPADRVVPCHDAARLYRGWYGCGFTQGRIP